MKISFLLILLLVSFLNIYSQTKKSVKASFTNESIKVDGFLSETIWSTSEKATDFIQFEPLNGAKSSEKTEFSILYDNTSVVFGIMMYDISKDSIYKELGERDDDDVNSDLIKVIINTFNDGINAVGFIVTAAGVHSDVKYTEDEEEYSWDAVWYSNVQMLDSGWSAEIKIPYSALRFPKKNIQEWGLNVIRQVRRKREISSWNFIDNKMDIENNQAGIITGIENVQPPIRLSFTPYLSYYLQYNEQKQLNYTLNGGLDLKYGINESFTLDMTLIPDFGQVQSDDKILNLTPFETYYGENRPFFTEGTELFNKGEIFYSRRIGGEPLNYEDVYTKLEAGDKLILNPSETKMINATKVSGRTNGGLGIGVFNAMTQQSNALIVDSSVNIKKIVTQPFTNYNMLVFDQSLKNNSYISLLSTNVYNSILFADVTGTVFNFYDNSKSYSLYGDFFMSNRKINNTNTTGKKYSLSTGKVSGNFKYGYDVEVFDEIYDQNDMGYLQNNDETNHTLSVEYNIYDPFWKMLNWHNAFAVNYSTLYNVSDFSSFQINYNTRGVFSNYLFSFFSISYAPLGVIDYYEPRLEDRYYKIPKHFSCNFMLSPDYRKNFLIDFSGGYTKIYTDKSRYSVWTGASPRIRFSNKFLLILGSNINYNNNDKGYVNSIDNDSIIFGNRNVTTVTNTISTSYIFNKKSSLNLRVRHYWSKAEYDKYYLLETDGNLSYLNNYNQTTSIYDLSFNAFTIDMSYTWNFAPGSEISLVWKNSIFQSQQAVISTKYFDNLENTINSPQSNSFSLKILYYIDYELLFKNRK